MWTVSDTRPLWKLISSVSRTLIRMALLDVPRKAPPFQRKMTSPWLPRSRERKAREMKLEPIGQVWRNDTLTEVHGGQARFTSEGAIFTKVKKL